MISQIEEHIKQGEYEQALTLLDMLEQVFAEQSEMRFSIHTLRAELQQGNAASYETLQQIKHMLVG